MILQLAWSGIVFIAMVTSAHCAQTQLMVPDGSACTSAKVLPDLALRIARNIEDQTMRDYVIGDICRPQLRLGALEDALSTANRLIVADGARDEVNSSIAMQYARNGDFEKAVNISRRIGDDGSHDRVLQMVAIELASRGKLRKSSEIVNAIRLPLSRAVSVAVITTAAVSSSQDVDSEVMFSRALRLAMNERDKQYIEKAVSEIALAQANSGQLSSSLETAKIIVESRSERSGLHHPDAAEIYASTLSEISLIAAQSGRLDTAYQVIEHIPAKNRQLRQATLGRLAVIEAKRGNVEAAMKIVQELDPSMKFYVDDGVLLFPRFEAQVGIALEFGGAQAVERSKYIHQALREAQAADVNELERICLLLKIVRAFDFVGERADSIVLLKTLVDEVFNNTAGERAYEKAMIVAEIARFTDVLKAVSLCREIHHRFMRGVAIRSVASVAASKMPLNRAISIGERFESDEEKVQWLLGIGDYGAP